VLAAATLAMGKPVFPDYVIVASFNPVLDLVLSSLIPLTSFLLLLMLCRNYESMGVSSLTHGAWARATIESPLAFASLSPIAASCALALRMWPLK
jgi:hypothetical protein